jgi:hypothetical protein
MSDAMVTVIPFAFDMPNSMPVAVYYSKPRVKHGHFGLRFYWLKSFLQKPSWR